MNNQNHSISNNSNTNNNNGGLFSNVQQAQSQPTTNNVQQQWGQSNAANQGSANMSLFGPQNSSGLFSNANIAQQQGVQVSNIFGNVQPNANTNVMQQQQQHIPTSLFSQSNANVAQHQGLFSNNSYVNNNLPQQPSHFSNANVQMMGNQGYVNPPQMYGYGQSLFNVQPHYQQVPVDPLQLFNDDEPLIQKVKQQHKDAKIQLEIKAQRSLVKLKTQTQLPAMVTLKSSGGTRTSVDLICVIDNSGSMSGQKIALVKSTVKFLLQTLTPADRLSIITFNSNGNRLCGLKCVTGENMPKFLNIVQNINAGGGTTINSGLSLALKTMRDRKYINNVTSIFLLSDGQDKGAQLTFKNCLQQNKNKELGIFTLHSFGFGSDHDEELMNKLCLIKDGAFYYIKELSTLDQAFCNALGGIISVAANQVIINLTNISQNIVEGIKIKKVYGKMWEKINENQYKITISQLMSGITKDFVLQLDIPSINTEVGDLDRVHHVLEATFTARTSSGQKINGKFVLQLTLLNQIQQIPDTIENVEVIENYLRVKAAESIEQNIKKADQQKYAQAQKGIEDMIQCIQNNPKARKQKINSLLTDLNQIKQKCSPQMYNQGRKIMMSAQNAHTMQNNYAYSNCVQTTMVQNLQAQKPGGPRTFN